MLAIDQGNTRTKCGLFRDGVLIRAWHADTDKGATAADLAAIGFAVPEVSAGTPIGLCSVVPELWPYWLEAAESYGSTLTRITGTTPTPLTNAYLTPDTLGPDRLMAAVAASELAGVPVVVGSLGTATVVDVVSADRAYLGGMIAPGITTAARALVGSASALWEVPWQQPAHAIGRASEEAMTSGLFHQAVGGIRAMLAAVRSELGTDAPAVLTGGWAERVAPYLDGVARIDPHLVLRGIAMTVGRLSDVM